MTTPSQKLQVEGTPVEIEEKDDIPMNGSNSSDEEHNINMDQLRKKFHKSLDINHPTQPELNDQSCFPLDYQISEIETTLRETKKRSISETKETKNEIGLVLDLELKLSPPGLSSENLSNPLKSTSWISLSSSSSSSQGTCVSSNLESDENLGGTSKEELLSLVVMGCTRCYIYVMVLKSDPSCPKCKNPNLLDVGENPIKKSRKSSI